MTRSNWTFSSSGGSSVRYTRFGTSAKRTRKRSPTLCRKSRKPSSWPIRRWRPDASGDPGSTFTPWTRSWRGPLCRRTTSMASMWSDFTTWARGARSWSTIWCRWTRRDSCFCPFPPLLARFGPCCLPRPSWRFVKYELNIS